jgi:hypothetical protein
MLIIVDPDARAAGLGEHPPRRHVRRSMAADAMTAAFFRLAVDSR